MSVTVEQRSVPRGSNDYLESAWALKERIRDEEGLLKQERGFFSDAYRRATVHVYVSPTDDLVGFAAARRDGYILFLAVNPDYQGEGFGAKLVADVASDCRNVSCHARTTNENALAFYRHLGFRIERRIDNYYEDGGDAYYLRLGDEEKLSERISQFFRR